MKTIDVSFVKASIAAYDPLNDSYTLHFIINDGGQRIFAKELKINNGISQAEQLFRDVRQRIKDGHKGSVDTDDPLGGIINVRFNSEEDAIIERLGRFLDAARDKARTMSRQRMSRFDVQRGMEGFSTDFIKERREA